MKNKNQVKIKWLVSKMGTIIEKKKKIHQLNISPLP